MVAAVLCAGGARRARCDVLQDAQDVSKPYLRNRP